MQVIKKLFHLCEVAIMMSIIFGCCKSRWSNFIRFIGVFHEFIFEVFFSWDLLKMINEIDEEKPLKQIKVFAKFNIGDIFTQKQNKCLIFHSCF